MPRLFLPTARETSVLLAVGFLSVGYALYLRYLVIEQPAVALACAAGLKTWACAIRALATELFRHSVFGWTALIAGGLGIVLYNVDLSALAAALLLISLARPAPAAAP